MGFRFRRSIRLIPGFRINLSKSGTSLSVGRRGATMNFGPKGKKMTIGLPGTGLSYSERFAAPAQNARRAPAAANLPGALATAGKVIITLALAGAAIAAIAAISGH